MAEKSGISWTDGTWNPWMGCDKVGPECEHCYIDRDLQKMGLQPWGKVHRSKTTWGAPFKAQKKAFAERTRIKLFTCSLSDFFHRGADAWRPEAWGVIRACPDVDFLILTKRAHRIAACLPPDWGAGCGVSVGMMAMAHRVDKLRQVPARIRFISAEPLLESLAGLDLTGIQWLIAGGESGTPHRDMDPAWAEELRQKCAAAGVAYWFKQDAGSRPGEREELLGRVYQDHPTGGLTTISQNLFDLME